MIIIDVGTWRIILEINTENQKESRWSDFEFEPIKEKDSKDKQAAGETKSIFVRRKYVGR